MCIVMLYFFHRKSEFLCDCRGIVSRMQITDNHRRIHLQKRFQTRNRLPQSLHRSQILQISHIRRRIKTSVHTDTKCIFQLAAHSQHLSFPRIGNHKRKRCISSGAADHIRLSFVIIHHRVVRPDADLSVMRQHTVTKTGQFCQCFLIVVADRRARCVAACHHQTIRHHKSVIVLKQKKLNRCIGKHHPNLGIVGRYRRCHASSLFSFQKKNRLLVTGNHLLLNLAHLTLPSDHVHICCHHSKRLCRSSLQRSQATDCLLIGCVTAKMKSANSFNRHDSSGFDGLSRINNCLSSPLFPSNQVNLRSTLVAADRLCIVSSRLWTVIFFCTVRTHRKFFHARPLPVIRKGIENRQPWATARTVDKRMQIPPVFRVKHFLFTLVTDGDIRRDENLSLCFFTLNNIKTLIRNRVFFQLHIDF